MASLAIRFLLPASDELEDAFNWYKERDVAAARQFSEVVVHKLDEAALKPHHWPRERDGTRHILLPPFSYYLVVRESGTHLVVVAVAHTSRRPGYWRKRLKDS